MILDFTDEEKKTLQAIEEAYEKLIKVQNKKILELRPYDPELDHDEWLRIESTRPREYPQPPEEIPHKKGEKAFRDEDYKAYRAAIEAFEAENKRVNEALDRLYSDWYNAGSDEWKEALKKLDKLEEEYNEAVKALIQKAEDRHFSELGNDHLRILEDAKDQVDRLIVCKYEYYEKLAKSGNFWAQDVRAQEDGTFLLDTTEEGKNIRQALNRHIEALSADPDLVNILYTYIEEALQNSEYVGDTGERGATVKKGARAKGETSLIAQPLDKRTVIITRLMNIVFNGKKTLERSYDLDFNDPKNRYDLGLYSADSPYKLKVAIDYNAIVDNELIKLPALTRMAKHIYNAIVSYWLQGNYKPTYRQIWRAACGNMKRAIKYDTNEKLEIERALLSFKASIAFSTGEIVEIGKADNKVSKIKEAGGAYQLLHYDTQYLKVNGQRTDVLLLDPNRRPVILEIAQALNNEYITDNIDFFDVKGLANTEENLDLKEYIFIRIKKMKNSHNGVKSNKIAIDTLVKELEIKPFDKTDAKDRVRKQRLVERIIKILDNAVEVNFIESYTVNKRKGSTEVISFTIELYKKKSYISNVA